MWPVDFRKGPKVQKPVGRFGFYGGRLGSSLGTPSPPHTGEVTPGPRWGTEQPQDPPPRSCSRWGRVGMNEREIAGSEEGPGASASADFPQRSDQYTPH